MGTISSSGLYTAPDLVPSSNSLTVTATSQADTTKSASATVSLAYPMPTLSSVSPTYVTVDSPPATLTLTGTGFTKASTVSFNSSALTTSYVSSTQLTAALPAADEGTEGQFNLAVANPSPGGGTSSAMQFNVVGGALAVTIIDLPSGTPANVTVTGPNGLNVVLTASQTITGAEGTYSVTAKGVAVGSGTYYATAPMQTVTLAAGNSANLTVDYYDIIPNTTKVLDQAGMQTLTIATDGTTMTMSSSSSVAASLAGGDVLASAPTAVAPNGLLVKILTVSSSGSEVSVTTSSATLEDAIQQSSFTFKQTLSPSNVQPSQTPSVKIQATLKASSHSAGDASSSIPDSCAGNPATFVQMYNLPLVQGTQGSGSAKSSDSITASGEIEVCPTLEFDFSISLFKVNSFKAVATLGEHAELTIQGEWAGSFEKRLNVGPPIDFEPILVFVGDVPLYLQPSVQFYVGTNGSVTAGFSTGIKQDAQAQGGISLENGQLSPIHSVTFNVGPAPLSLDASLDAKGYAGAELDLTIDDVLTPHLDIDGYLEFKADVSSNPWWTLSAGLEGDIGVKAQFLGYEKDWDIPDVFDYSVPVLSASGPFSSSSLAPTLSGVSPNSGSVGTPSLTVLLTGSNFVPDSVALFNGNALATTFVDTGDLTAMLPSSVFVVDGVYPITVSNPDTSGAVSSAQNFSVTGAVVTVSPSTAQVPARGLQQFNANVLGPPNNAVAWSVNGAAGGNSTVGTISAAGLYTAPAAPPNPATVTVTATSQAMPSVSSSARVTVGPYAEKPVYSFTSLTDGAAPSVPLIDAKDGYYYGTTQQGGTYGYGTTFRVDSMGNVTPLHEFSGTYGEYLQSPLVQASDGYFYGTAFAGGDLSCTTADGFTGCGTVFKMDSSGVVTVLHMFEGGTEGEEPGGKLTIGTDGYFYGITNRGGASGFGTVFQMDSSGKVNTLHSFSGGTDGLLPEGGLIQATDGYFYGTTGGGGDLSCQIWTGYQGCGTVFRIDPAEHFTTLYTFEGGTDGANPTEDLLEASDGYLYGTTLFGGDASCSVSGYTGCGTIFKMDTAGHLILVHDFSGGSEGGVPFSALIQAGDGDFYGTATAGGNPACSVTASDEEYPTYVGCGTVFKMDSAGNVNALYSFSGSPTDGSNPFAALIEGSDGYLYGTTRWGGTDSSCPYTDNGGCGTVFKVSGPGGPLPQQQRTQTKRFVSRWLNPKPLTPTSRPVSRIQSGQVITPVQNLRGLKLPPKVR